MRPCLQKPRRGKPNNLLLFWFFEALKKPVSSGSKCAPPFSPKTTFFFLNSYVDILLFFSTWNDGGRTLTLHQPYVLPQVPRQDWNILLECWRLGTEVLMATCPQLGSGKVAEGACGSLHTVWLCWDSMPKTTLLTMYLGVWEAGPLWEAWIWAISNTCDFFK